uniref:Uncharacterized protein n=1 Tax=Glossina pallidipes TaxID=7398 RepID=A0A1B0A3N5_GLOPL
MELEYFLCNSTFLIYTENITIVGLPDFVNNDFKIALYAKEAQRYLCFNEHWKLVGMSRYIDCNCVTIRTQKQLTSNGNKRSSNAETLI